MQHLEKLKIKFDREVQILEMTEKNDLDQATGPQSQSPKSENFEKNCFLLPKSRKSKRSSVKQKTTISYNDIITHWFFSLNPKSDNVVMAIDLRHRLHCLNETLAGNYLGYILLRKTELKSPISIRQAINRILNQEGVGYTKLPTYKEFRKYPLGISSNFSAFYKNVSLSGFQATHFQPIIDDHMANMCGFITPCREDHIYIYQCNQHELACVILTGSNRICATVLENSKLLSEKMSSYILD